MISKIIVHPQVEKREEKAEGLLSQVGLLRGNVDLLWLDDEGIGIEQARKIKDFLSLKPYRDKHQAVVIINADDLTIGAQNALLKTLEEPSPEAIIILGISSEDRLLQTITSRCQVINLAQNDGAASGAAQKHQKEIELLLKSTIEERFKFIEKLEKREEFLQDLTLFFRHRLINIQHRLINIQHPMLDIVPYLEDLLEAEKWAAQNVNIRAILEYLMLKMPQEGE